MKTFLVIVGSFIIGLGVAYVSLRFPEEKLTYTLLESAKFGDITYQNVQISNTGWNPAENVRLIITREGLKPENIKASSPLLPSEVGQGEIGRFDLIRRNELVSVSFSFKGKPLTPEEISFKSDRSIARLVEKKKGWEFDWKSFWIGVLIFFGFFVIIGVISEVSSAKKKKMKQEQTNETKKEDKTQKKGET